MEIFAKILTIFWKFCKIFRNPQNFGKILQKFFQKFTEITAYEALRSFIFWKRSSEIFKKNQVWLWNFIFNFSKCFYVEDSKFAFGFVTYGVDTTFSPDTASSLFKLNFQKIKFQKSIESQFWLLRSSRVSVNSHHVFS